MMTSDALQEIEACLSRTGYSLTFPPELEALYEAKRGPGRTRSIQRYLLLYVAFILVCLFCDIQARIPILRVSLTLRLGICIPLTLLSFFLLGRRYPSWLLGWIAVTPMMAETVLSGTLARLVGGQPGDNIMIGPALCIFAQTLIAPVPFKYALRGLLASLTFYLAFSLTPWPDHPPIGAQAPTFACGVGLVALYERHRRERAERKDFLLSESNRLRLEDIVRLNAHLERLSSTDGLTGIFNRRYLDTALRRLWTVAVGKQRWIGIILIDIDRFKTVNDTAGHQHGDMCLQEVARIVQRSVRVGVDTVARYGGEEFVVILPDADGTDVSVVGERIRKEIEGTRLPGAIGSIITISAGAVAMQGGGDSAVTLEEFLKAADQALYEAKRSGRNRVIRSDMSSR